MFDFLFRLPPNSGSVYNIAEKRAALCYIAQTMLLDYLADLCFVYDFPNCRRAAYICLSVSVLIFFQLLYMFSV
jgi:hypothetical protein